MLLGAFGNADKPSLLEKAKTLQTKGQDEIKGLNEHRYSDQKLYLDVKKLSELIQEITNASDEPKLTHLASEVNNLEVAMKVHIKQAHEFVEQREAMEKDSWRLMDDAQKVATHLKVIRPKEGEELQMNISYLAGLIFQIVNAVDQANLNRVAPQYEALKAQIQKQMEAAKGMH